MRKTAFVYNFNNLRLRFKITMFWISKVFVSPDTVSIIPADKSCEGASLTSITIRAHQTISTCPISRDTNTVFH